jgi:tetratricopeptide (TPR) repeat protein
MARKWAAIIAAGWILAATLASAQSGMSTIEYIDSLPSPVLMDGVGNSHLEISTDVEDAQRFFDQGVSLLHDFWWFEAYRSFRRAAELDPDAPMPHMGLYMAADNMANLSGDEREAQLSIASEKIAELRGNATAREGFYLDAVMHYHEKEGDEAEVAYRQELEALLNEYPNEIEARLFLWLVLDGGFDAKGRPRDDQLYSQLLLESELDTHPDHQGLLHYWIHNQESGKHPESALGAANRLASLAPNAGHIVHMPGHIHFIMGNYDAAHEQFQRSEQADARYLAKYGIAPIFTWNYLHNVSFLIANLAEAGRYSEAQEYASKFAIMADESDFKDYSGYTMLSGRAVLEPVKVALRFGDFEAAATALREGPEYRGDDAESFAVSRAAYQAYIDGMAAAQSGRAEVAGSALNRLDAILWRANRDDVSLRSARVLNIASLELQGLVEHGRGENEKAVATLQRAIELEDELRYREPPPYVRPVLESLAQVHLAAGQWDEARGAYERLLEKRKKSGFALFGLARTHELAGRPADARSAYRDFLASWSSADAGLEQRRHAENWLAANP